MLKPMHITTKTKQNTYFVIENQLKPMRIAANIAQKEHDTRVETSTREAQR
jgi:hypothetical protein